MQATADTPRLARPRAARALTYLLFGLALVYVAYGLHGLMLGNPTDGSQRWREVHYIFRGTAPEQVTAELGARGYSRDALPPATETGWTSYDPSIGADVWTYAPWSYPTLAAIFWPSLPVAKISLALWMLAALGFVAVSTHRLFRPFGADAALLMTAAALAVSGNGNAFKIGQTAILVVAALLVVRRLEARRTLPAAVATGLAFGVAMIKPTITIPFGIALLVRGRWVAIVVAGLFCAASAGATWGMTGVDPLRWLGRMTAEASGDYATKGAIGPVHLLTMPGIDRARALKLLAVGCCAVALVLAFLWRRAPMLTQLAIGAVAGWMWTYHQAYDSPMMIFLLLATGRLALALARPSRLAWATFLLVGVSLWLPFRLPGAPVAADRAFRTAVQVMQLVVWPLGLAVLLWHTPRDRAAGHEDSSLEDPLDPTLVRLPA